jgi:hypothetical protein
MRKRASVLGRRFPLVLCFWLTSLLPSSSEARTNPLLSIQQQIQKPNVLILLDTSTSMMNLPGENDIDLQEAGPDCEDGDAYCRTIGTNGRCFFSSGGRFGAGVRNDHVSCTTDAQCNSKGFCKLNAPQGCAADWECAQWGGSCVGVCSNNLNTNCWGDGGCGGGTCMGTCANTPGNACTAFSGCSFGDPCSYNAADFCVKNSTSSMRIKMCRLSFKKCQDDDDCQSVTGDTCGPASSRLIVAKSALNSLVQQFYQTVNFGFMTFYQVGYYPYFEITSGTTNQTRTTFLDRSVLEAAVTPCFSLAAGPSATCSLNGTTYTRVASNNSRYRLNRGTYFDTSNASWGGACGIECQISGVGTGIYEGSYYTFSVPIGTPTSIVRQFSDYVGKTRSADGKNYYYYEIPPSQRNINNIYHDGAPVVIGTGPWQTACNGNVGAIRTPELIPFMDTARDLSTANALTMARRLNAAFAKASFGGIMAQGGTPSGCALKNENGPINDEWGNPIGYSPSGAAPDRSVYHYMEKVKQENLANGVACRSNHVIFLTDGVPNGPGETDCGNPACGADPLTAACQCKSVWSARSLYRDLGVKVHVVGFSGTVAFPYGAAVINNIARAGGTTPHFAINRSELVNALTSAIYDAVRGSYATSPIAVGGLGASNGSLVLDSRADFPTWKGHLIAYDAANGNQIKWDAATQFDGTANPNFWKTRNVWTSDGTNMIKVLVDSATGTITNASTLRALGLGTTDAEAALVARWMLGDPALSNPAVLGAIVNSTPTQVANGSLSLTYAGASDGMLHAFHSVTQSVGGTTFQGGAEAFAYIPQDMLKVIRRLYAQGGQRMDPREHIFGLANSPKVRRICTANCTEAGQEQWKTVLIMPEGMGGNDLFAIDVSAPFSGTGVKSAVGTPPVTLLWHTEHAVSSSAKTSYDGALGKTLSLPAFYYAKSSTRSDYRTILASGYTEASNSSIGLKIVNANTSNGEVINATSVQGMGATCSKPRVDPTEPTLLSDVAIARRFGAYDFERIASAYVGDTWGNLFRYVPPADSSGNIASGAGTVSTVDSFTCSQPLHFSPTIIQLDRHDASKHPGEIYIAQATNSPLDSLTAEVTASFPASQIIIRKDVASGGSTITPDLNWGPSNGRIVLSASNPNEICAVWNSTTNTCTTAMPTRARPMGSPTGVLRDDYEGFALISSWYVPDANGCTKGNTYLVIHQVLANEQVKQLYGQNIGSEPVVGAVFAGGKLLVVLENGPREITTAGLAGIETVPTTQTVGTGLVDRYRRIGWTELP